MSIHRIKSGETLIVEGPARITVEDGELTLIGAPIRQGDYLVVKKSRQVAIEGVTDSKLTISLGVGAHMDLLNTTTIPSKWTELAETLKSHDLPFKTVFFGDVDTGKTTFAMYLGNLFCQWGVNSAILSTDIGQGYPGLISLYQLNCPIIDITELTPTDAYFVGAISPNCFEHRVITGTQKMLRTAQQLKTQALFVDTTGWVYGHKARELKASLLQLIQPDILIIVERERELEHLVKPFLNLIDEIYRMPISPKIRYRDRTDRKFLRESMLSRQLTADSNTFEFHFNDIGFINSFLNTGKIVSDAIGEKIREIVGYVPEYIELCSDALLIVENIEQPLSNSMIEKLQEEFSYLTIRVFDSKTIENVLIGLTDSQNNFLGFGIVTHIDFVKQIITILSSVTKDKIASIQFGSLKVTQSGQEICWIRPYSF